MTRDAAAACRLLSEHFWETTNIILKSGFSEARQASSDSSATAPKVG
jgi:hypothetical protein